MSRASAELVFKAYNEIKQKRKPKPKEKKTFLRIFSPYLKKYLRIEI